MSWTLTPAAPGPGSPAALVALARTTVESWLLLHPGVQLVGVSAGGNHDRHALGDECVPRHPGPRAALAAKLGTLSAIEIDFLSARPLWG